MVALAMAVDHEVGERTPEWRQGWEQYFKPLYNDLVSKGLLVGYSVDVEDVHTESPLWRRWHVVTLSPNIGTQDKITAAFDAAAAKRKPRGAESVNSGRTGHARTGSPPGHRGPMAPPMAPPALDPALTTTTRSTAFFLRSCPSSQIPFISS